jgi:ABC-type antimicrobial peptide transport system permease subunit
MSFIGLSITKNGWTGYRTVKTAASLFEEHSYSTAPHLVVSIVSNSSERSWLIPVQGRPPAVFLTFAGGIIGVIIGWGVSYLVDRMGFMSTIVTPDIVILAVSVSVAIGLFFGFYPAWNASRLNPIEALRSE